MPASPRDVIVRDLELPNATSNLNLEEKTSVQAETAAETGGSLLRSLAAHFLIAT